MPELPEVQTIVNDLKKRIIGRRIVDIWSDWPKMFKGVSVSSFSELIKGRRILNIRRRAKNILIELDDNLLLLIHQKLTGHLLLGRWEVERRKKKNRIVPLAPKDVVADPYNSYIHLIFYLDNGQMLALSDLRKFAKVILGAKERIANLSELRKLGPEPLDRSFKFEQFVKLINAERRKIKQVLMDQEVIAGIGNIYSDDILWQAKIHPLKPANNLSEPELKRLWQAMRQILKKALRLRGASVSDYRDTSGKKGHYAEARLAYQREGEPCLRCGAKIKRIKLGGRSAHYCPECQRNQQPTTNN